MSTFLNGWKHFNLSFFVLRSQMLCAWESAGDYLS
jgi:hypothetical protein